MKRVIQDESRQGIALIIVLGMLSVMMILGVAFVITMRTERVAAGNYMEVMKARHLVYTALARAMDDIEEDMQYPLYASTNYPAWPTNYLDTFAKSVDLYTGDALELIPRPIFDLCRKLASPGQVWGTTGDNIIDDNAEWGDAAGTSTDPRYWIEQIESDGQRAVGQITSVNANWLNTDMTGWEDDDPAASDPLANQDRYRTALPQWQEVEEGGGKIAYMVLNLSGLLDANYVGGGTRSMGSDPSEMQISNLPDVANEASVWTHRNGNAPYERTYDFAFGNGGLNGDPKNFCVYSRFVPDMRPGDVFADGPVNIGGTVADLNTLKSKIIDAFCWSITPNPDAGTLSMLDKNVRGPALYNNLIDYVDADNVPGSAVAAAGSTSGPYVDRAPMINELFVTNTFNIAASGAVTSPSRVMVYVECWYPFLVAPSQPKGSFTLHYDIDFDLTGPGAQAPAGMFLSTTIQKTQPLNMALSFPLSIQVYLVPPAVTNTPATQPIIYDVVFSDVHIVDDDTGNEVDRIPDTKITVANPSQAAGVWRAGGGADVIDPRFNWSPQHWSAKPDYPYASSLGNVNEGASAFIAQNFGQEAYCDANTPMYIANRSMRSVGELAYLSHPGVWQNVNGGVGIPVNPDMAVPLLWRTLRPYDSGLGRADRFFDHFSLTNSSVYVGRVNPNTEHRDVLAAAYDGMRIDEYPEQAGATTVGFATAQDLADVIQGYATNAYDVVSDLGQLNIANDLFAAAGVNGGTEFEKESVYRNAHGLFHTRQNLFAILLAGKSKIAVEQRALAIVWRDPQEVGGQHRSFIRWFTWLEK